MKKDNFEYKVSAAGRVNIIGEHVDYCGGKVFPAALSLKNTVYVRTNGTNKINLSWTTLPDKVTIDIDKLGEYAHLPFGNYQAGCAYIWQQTGHKVVGCDMLQDCTVPFGSGLSSSAAIEVSTLAALATIGGEKIDPKEIALLAQRAEREYAHVNCGIMDQYTSANGKADNAILLDCATVTHEYVPLKLGDYALVITNCNKPHSLITSKYNERRTETEEALRLLKQHLDVNCLAEVTPSQFEECKHCLPQPIRDRAEHVVYECYRVEEAVSAMRNGDLVTLGKLLNQSHASLRDKYQVTGIELDTLAEAAQAHEGCLGSRMTGAGFGGCTISIVAKDAVDDFKKAIRIKYFDTIGYEPSFYDAEIADGIVVEKLQ